MSDLHELALARLPQQNRVNLELENEYQRLKTIKSTQDIILAARIEDNKAKAEQAIKAYKAKKYAQQRILSQADIDTRKPTDMPEREITYRLKRLGV